MRFQQKRQSYSDVTVNQLLWPDSGGDAQSAATMSEAEAPPKPSPIDERRRSVVVNPTPQTPNTVDATAGTNGDKLVLVFVGLPGRGKTHIARRLARYLEFFHGAPSQVFNTGEYRRKRLGSCPGPDFFAPDNSEGQALRQTFAEEALNDLKVWMEAENTLGRVGILDGSNTTVERRQWILSELASVVGQKVTSELPPRCSLYTLVSCFVAFGFIALSYAHKLATLLSPSKPLSSQLIDHHHF